MSISTSRIETEAEFLARCGAATTAIALIINDDLTRDALGEERRLDDFKVGGLMDALAIIGEASSGRGERLKELLSPEVQS